MEVRNAVKKDVARIGELNDMSYDEVKSNPDLGITLRRRRPTKADIKRWRERTYGWLSRGDILYDVAEEDGKFIGYCFVMKKDLPESEASHVGVLGVKIADGWRGRGVGTALMKHMIRRCRGRFEMLEVSVFSNNKAVRLYKRLGFRTWGVAPRYVKRGKRYIDVVHMYLRL